MSNYHSAKVNGVKCLVCEEINVYGQKHGICPAEKALQLGQSKGCVKFIAHIFRGTEDNPKQTDYGWYEIDMANIPWTKINVQPKTQERQVILEYAQIMTKTTDPSFAPVAVAPVVVPPSPSVPVVVPSVVVPPTAPVEVPNTLVPEVVSQLTENEIRINKAREVGREISKKVVSNIEAMELTNLERHIIINEIIATLTKKAGDFLDYSMMKVRNS